MSVSRDRSRAANSCALTTSIVALGHMLRKETLDEMCPAVDKDDTKLLRNCVDFLRGDGAPARRWETVATPLINQIAESFRGELHDDAIEYLRYISEKKAKQTIVHSCAGTGADQFSDVITGIHTAARQVKLRAGKRTSVIVLTDILAKKDALLGNANGSIRIGESTFSLRALVLRYPGHYRSAPAHFDLSERRSPCTRLSLSL